MRNLIRQYAIVCYYIDQHLAMKILYDYQTFSVQRFGGVSRYFYELINYYATHNSLDTVLGFKYSQNDYIVNSQFAKQIIIPKEKNIPFSQFFPFVQFKGKGRIFKLFNKVTNNCDIIGENEKYSIQLLKDQDFDIFHPTYYNPYFLDYIKAKPFVLTVYDTIHELYPEYFPLNDPNVAWKKMLVTKAAKIIAISENTKQDILKYYDIPANKVKVIYLNSNLEKDPQEVAIDIDLPKKFLMFVGNRGAYKNFYFFLLAAAALIKKDKELHIICAGGGNFNAMEQQYLNKLNLSKNISYIDATDSKLIQLYSNALAFVYPSLYEGFGIPVVEAFKFGCPVICSNTSSFPEIAEDAAEYFDPKDIDSITEAIENVIQNPKRRTELINKGRAQAQKYSAERTALETLELYRSI
jgi:glycosyltransferase involved in cell wall biosynthesis